MEMEDDSEGHMMEGNCNSFTIIIESPGEDMYMEGEGMMDENGEMMYGEEMDEEGMEH